MSVNLDQKYILGIDIVDEQHSHLIEIGNKLLSLLELGDSIDHYDEIMTILNELRDYTQYHFTSEEEIFKDLDYPEKDVHIMEHQFFMKKVDKFFDEDIDNQQIDNLKKLTDFVLGWILHHILNTDNEYAAIMNDNE